MLIDAPQDGEGGERNDVPKKGESSFPPNPPTPHQEDGSSDAPPPSYTPSATASTSTSSPSAPPLPPSLPSSLLNASKSSHVSLSSSNSAINTSHIIDLNIVVPPSALPPPKREELVEGGLEGERVNGYWSSQNGGVKVKLGVRGKEGSEGKRVRAKAESQNGSVRIEVLSRLPITTPLSLSLTSSNGSVTIFLPRSFHGPVTHSTNNGSVKISAAVQPFYTRISKDKGFVGDMTGWDGALGLGDVKDDEGMKATEAEGLLDECVLKSGNGSVRISFAEEIEEGGSGKGWFGGLFGGGGGGGEKKKEVEGGKKEEKATSSW